MKNKHIFIPLFVFIGAAVISLVTSIIDYKVVNKDLAYSSEVVQFNYDGASDGKDPNGNPFDPVDFLSDDIISSALNKSELDYDVETVRPYISLENVVPANIVDEINSYEKIVGDNSNSREMSSDDYRSVRYRFIVYQDLGKGLSTSKLNNFVTNLVDEYCNEFYITYQKAFNDSAIEQLFEIDKYDYTYQAQIYSVKLQNLMDYAKSIYDEHNDFLVEGKSFNDLYLRAEYLMNTDISKINSIIALNALSKDVERLKDYFSYLIENLNYSKAKYIADLTAVSAQLDSYEIDSTVYVGTGDSVIKVESNSIETYNTLVAKQINISNNIASINKQIADYQDKLDILNSSSSTTEAENIVKELISDLGDDYVDLRELFKVMLEEYNNKYVSESAISKENIVYKSNSLLSTAFIVRTINVASPILLATLLGIAVYYLVRAIKKEKRSVQ